MKKNKAISWIVLIVGSLTLAVMAIIEYYNHKNHIEWSAPENIVLIKYGALELCVIVAFIIVRLITRKLNKEQFFREN